MAQSGIRLLADNDISSNVVAALNAAGIKAIRALSQEFDPGTADEIWVPEAVRRNYVCLSCDRKMLTRPDVVSFLEKRTARIVFLPAAFNQYRVRQKLIWLLRYWDKIEEFAASLSPGELVEISTRGKAKPIRLAVSPESRPATAQLS